MTLGTAHCSGRVEIRGQVSVSGPQSDDYEGRGLPPSISALFRDSRIQQVVVVSATPEAENSVVYQRLIEDPDYREPRPAAKRELTRETVEAWFISAGFPRPTHMHPLINEYDKNRDDNWWLAITDLGFIKVGWRSKVIAIDWAGTKIRRYVTIDDVTKDFNMVHAWSVPKAIEYLSALRIPE